MAAKYVVATHYTLCLSRRLILIIDRACGCYSRDLSSRTMTFMSEAIGIVDPLSTEPCKKKIYKQLSTTCCVDAETYLSPGIVGSCTLTFTPIIYDTISFQIVTTFREVI